MIATVHRRLALTLDPELDEALHAAAAVLGSSRPASRVARELILRGARDLLANSGSELDRWLDGKGASPATRSIGEMLAVVADLAPPDPGNPRALSDALAQMRAEDDR